MQEGGGGRETCSEREGGGVGVARLHVVYLEANRVGKGREWDGNQEYWRIRLVNSHILCILLFLLLIKDFHYC